MKREDGHVRGDADSLATHTDVLKLTTRIIPKQLMGR